MDKLIAYFSASGITERAAKGSCFCSRGCFVPH